MRLEDLDFSYPEALVAQEPRRPSRVLWVENGEPRELEWGPFLNQFRSGDSLVVNNTKVIPRRVFGKAGDKEFETLFLDPVDESRRIWKVLCPAGRLKRGEAILFPGGVQGTIRQGGRPQTLELTQALSENYFFEVGEMPLPPYIQKARGERHQRKADRDWYQSIFAKIDGSQAAPTASLHFSEQDLGELRSRGVQIVPVTLHVGLGTFLPIETHEVLEHVMHQEHFEVPEESWQAIQKTKAAGGRIWALGTTATRAVESYARGIHGGTTELFLHPEEQPRVVDILLTNFHQPRTTLLLLVAAFSNLKTLHAGYRWAVERSFRLFSYGDLTVWVRE